MKPIFIFDVDGTICKSRQKVDLFFDNTLKEITKRNTVCLATGSDYQKTYEQLGADLLENHIYMSFNCAGNSVWKKGKEVYKSDWRMPDDAWAWLEEQLYTSHFNLRTGKHIEERTGCVNFSVVGRNATLGERKLYEKWDSKTGERKKIASRFNERFGMEHNIVAQVAGATGFDIFPIGLDKAQIIDWDVFHNSPIWFFGDDMQPGGNDHSLAEAIRQRDFEGDKVFPVLDADHTYSILHEQWSNF